MQTTKKAILKKPYWRGMSNSNFVAYWPAGSIVEVYKGRGRKSYTVILSENEFDEVGGTWKGATSDLKFIKQ